MTVTTVAFRDAVLRRLMVIAATEKIVMTELVRRAVDEWLARRTANPTRQGKRGNP